MKNYELIYRQFGTQAILIEWPQHINRDILDDMLAFQKIIASSLYQEVEESVPAYASLTLFFKEVHDQSKLIERLKELYTQRVGIKLNSKTWNIPVCYDTSFGIDLETLSVATKLSVEEIINKHSAKSYFVYFIGFLPGFLYLGGLDELLHFPRKNTPRLQIKKGSVGIGGTQTGIYPITSPGGWNIIGNTPVPLFDSAQEKPCFAQPGDKIKFDPISLKEYNHTSEVVKSGSYIIKSETA